VLRMIRSLGQLLPELARTVLARRVTVHFPFAPLELPAYFRGRIVVKPGLCTGCGRCARRCPAFALELEREDREHFRLIHYPDRCAYCGECQSACAFEAISQVNEFTQASSDRESLVSVLVDRG
jgi:formate hydrogenlyase subunit 6/NADH:ubiquinone oxidoreductase subunit I